jgi:glycerol-3-phosphate dehydrogenase subunit B
MTNALPDIQCDLLVIGTGMAGMAAALFAARRGLDTVQVGMTSEIGFASGLLDLLGVHPVAEGRVRKDPWKALAELARDHPRHPYSRIGVDAIRAALTEFLKVLAAGGLPYHCHEGRNARVLTPLGTVKTTYAVPASMALAESLLDDRRPCLLVDHPGLKGYSARQIKATLADRWPGLQTVRLPFPGLSGELQTERAARRLETPSAREALARAIRRHLGDARAVGVPAVLGVSRAHAVFTALQAAIGVPVFEIPTMLPAVTGLRLRECLERELPRMGVRARYQQKVLAAPVVSGTGITAAVGGETAEARVTARAVILASGRFFGQGLHADRHAIRETIFDLPVHQPDHRSLWHCKQLFDRAGHPIHRAGLAVDALLRPCDEGGNCMYPNLFAAGSILAHQDWIRQKCGSGLAIASAYAAVRASERVLGRSPSAA